MNAPVKFYQTGTFTVGNRLLDEGNRSVQATTGREADWFAQLTAETVSVRYSKGFPTRVWTKRAGARNEALDCRVYAYSALQSLAVNWGQLARAKFRATAAQPQPEAAPIEAQPQPAPQPQQPAPRQPFVMRRPGGWLNGGGWRS